MEYLLWERMLFVQYIFLEEVITLGTKYPLQTLFPALGNTDSRANLLSSRKNGRLAKLTSSSPLKHSKNHC